MLSLIEFIHEFDKITAKRLRGVARPWTDDRVLQEFHFSNLRRELDRTNRILYRIFKGSLKKLTFANLMAHRMVSRYKFSEEHGLFKSYEEFERVYRKRRNDGEQVRPPSFISCSSDEVFLGRVKNAFDIDVAVVTAIGSKPTLETAWRVMSKIVGKFTGWQCALDAEMYGYVSNEAEFMHIGPGAAYCMKTLGITKHDLHDIHEEINGTFQCPELKYRFAEVEGALCEYARYIKWNSMYPGKFRSYYHNSEPLVPVPLDSAILRCYKDENGSGR